MFRSTLKSNRILSSTIFVLLVFFLVQFSFAQASSSSTVTWTTSGDFSSNDATTGSVTSPSQVVFTGDKLTLDGQEFKTVGAGGNSAFSVAIKSDGTLWAWGQNSSAELGVGDTDDRSTPTQIGTDTDWLWVVIGESFSLAMKSDHTIWAWGYNGDGELGLGDFDQRDTPTQIGTDSDWQSIFAGGTAAFAIKQDGTLWAWGGNSGGELGLGDTDHRNVPTKVGTDSDWKEASSSYDHFSVAIKQDGTLWSTGYNGDGELGTGDKIESHTFIQAGNDTDWQSVSCGYGHTLAIKTDGTLWAWGYNGDGELGLGDGDIRLVPTQIGSDNNWLSIKGGADEQSLAVKADGTLWAWGYNGYGELGLGDSDLRDVPTQVGTDTDWEIAVVGYYHSLAIKKNGAIYSWGGNSNGQLGLSFIDNVVVIPKQESTFATNWQSISNGGDYFNLAIKQDGTLWGWGFNGYGQLGLGDTADRSIPTQVGTDNNWQTVIAAYGDFTFAIKNDGTLWAWGHNTDGELGLGDNLNRDTPTQVGVETDWQKIFVGFTFTLGIKQDGSLWAWGGNAYGELGLGDNNPRNVPTQVGSGTDWYDFASQGGGEYAVALKSDGTLWTWGRNNIGQLGLGDNDPRNIPTQVGIDTDWELAAAGFDFTIAKKSDGTIWEWGNNITGQLGLGDNDPRDVPTLMGTDTDWQKISAGTLYGNSFSIKTDGTLWAWGDNSAGELGLGDLDNRNVPTKVGLNTDWKEVSAGGDHTIVLKQNNTLWAFGDNSSGQLGINLYSPNLVDASIWRPSFYYFSSGNLSGLKFDIGSGKTANWSSLDWTAVSLPANTSIAFRVRTSNDDITYSDWSAWFTQSIVSSISGTADISSASSSRYIEIGATLTSTDGISTPTLNDFSLTYTEVILPSGGGAAPGAPPITTIPTSVPTPPTDNTQTPNQDTPGTVNIPPNVLTNFFITPKTLIAGTSGQNIKTLQQILNELGFSVSTQGPGSPGHETTYFGPLTKKALILFQEAHSNEILKPLGLKHGTGILGPYTLKFLKSLLGQ